MRYSSGQKRQGNSSAGSSLREVGSRTLHGLVLDSVVVEFAASEIGVLLDPTA